MKFSEVKVVGKPLSSRYLHTMIYDPKTPRLICCGGRTPGAKFFADVAIFDLNTNQWHIQSSKSNPSLGGHTAHFIHVNGEDRMYVIGGSSTRQKLNTKLFYLKIRDEKEESLTWVTAGALPTPRTGHCSLQVGTSILIFGGYDGITSRNDLLLLNTETGQWNTPPVKGNPPPPRSGHRAVYFSDSFVLVHGGVDTAGKHLTDAWALNTRTWEWLQPATPLRLTPRYNHSMILVADEIFFWGGQTVNPGPAQVIEVCSIVQSPAPSSSDSSTPRPLAQSDSRGSLRASRGPDTGRLSVPTTSEASQSERSHNESSSEASSRLEQYLSGAIISLKHEKSRTAELSLQLENLRTGNAGLSDKLSELTADIVRLTQDKEVLAANLSVASDRLKLRRTKHEKLQKEHKSLKLRLEEKEIHLAAQRSKYEQILEQKEDADEAIATLQAQIAALQQQLATATSPSASELSRAVYEKARETEQVAALKLKVEAVSAKCGKLAQALIESETKEEELLATNGLLTEENAALRAAAAKAAEVVPPPPADAFQLPCANQLDELSLDGLAELELRMQKTMTEITAAKSRVIGRQLQLLETQRKQLAESKLCAVCFDAPIRVVTMPCRHRVLCLNCAERLKYCPLCRELIQQKIDTHE